jgi:hypothetical protein
MTTLTSELELVSSANATAPMPSVSSKYSYINTKAIVSEVEQRGWSLIKQSQAHVRKPEKNGFQRHLLIFENEKYNDYLDGNLIGRNQLAIRNSHDVSSSLQMFIGHMRILCSNQIFAKNFGSEGFYETIKHLGGEDRTNEAITKFENLVDRMNVWRSVLKQLSNTNMTEEQMYSFAEKSIELRFKGSPFIKDITPDMVLQSRRIEDGKNDAWTVFNRVQENIIKGGIPVKTNRPNKNGGNFKFTTRGIRSINTLPDLNDSMLAALHEVVHLN